MFLWIIQHPLNTTGDNGVLMILWWWLMTNTVINTTYGDNGILKIGKIAVALKYLSQFWYLEMTLINCKVHLELNCSKDCIMSAIAYTTFKITNTKLCVPIVTLSRTDNVKLVKLLQDGFNRPVYWNEYQTKIIKSKFRQQQSYKISSWCFFSRS